MNFINRSLSTLLLFVFCMCMVSPSGMYAADNSNLKKRSQVARALQSVEFAATLGSGEPVVISKDKLAVLMGEGEAEKPFAQSHTTIDDLKRQEDREFFWRLLKSSFCMSLFFAFYKTGLSRSRRLIATIILSSLFSLICNVAENYSV